jgi:hypothetical protein
MTNDHLIINKIIKPLRKTIVAGHPLVLISEEYGYKNWFWFPRKSKKEVIKWWKRQHNKPNRWPIQFTEIGEFVSASYYKNASELLETDLLYSLWYKLKNMRLDSIWFSHVFNSEDTYLLLRKNLDVYHADFHASRIFDEKCYLIPEIENVELSFYKEED